MENPNTSENAPSNAPSLVRTHIPEAALSVRRRPARYLLFYVFWICARVYTLTWGIQSLIVGIYGIIEGRWKV